MIEIAKPIPIHTSGRILWKRCRRKWNWQDRTREALVPVGDQAISPLWLGTGFHFALEDYHGYNLFGRPSEAFLAYCAAFGRRAVPSDFEDLRRLGVGMLNYYSDHWYPRRKGQFRTHWARGVPNGAYDRFHRGLALSGRSITRDLEPQVEVRFQVPIPGLDPARAVYRGTLDRVVRDTFGRLWIVDYKTAARIDTNKLETDPQIGAYLWAGRLLYGEPIEGIVYLQARKDAPEEPAWVQGGRFSLNKMQPTTYSLYRKAVMDKFGKVPTMYKGFLDYLMTLESPEGDNFIVWTLVRRNEASADSEANKITVESTEMLSMERDDVRLYPNPTRDCSWDCQFRTACIARDDGSDWEYILREGFRPQTDQDESWRDRIKYPGDPVEQTEEVFAID